MEEPRIVSLPKCPDARGNLSFIEQRAHVPFDIARVYWIYDVPGGAGRGGHAYRSNHELVVALSGSFDVVVDNGFSRSCYSLNRSYFGLYIPAGHWREIVNFSTNSVALVLASQPYDESEYIRGYEEFLKFSRNERK